MSRRVDVRIEDVLIASIDVEIFRLGGPVAAERGFNAATNGPAAFRGNKNPGADTPGFSQRV